MRSPDQTVLERDLAGSGGAEPWFASSALPNGIRSSAKPYIPLTSMNGFGIFRPRWFVSIANSFSPVTLLFFALQIPAELWLRARTPA
jgi:hypothetical protein